MRDLSFEEALAEMRARAVRPPAEEVPVGEASGRRLADHVRSLGNHPRFTNSAMDGYAVRAADTPGELRLVGESRAGAPWEGTLGAGEAIGISTGAELPDGADAVLRKEDAEEREGLVATAERVETGRDVRRAGEDLALGEILMAAGAVVPAHAVAALAAAGHASVPCDRRPRVAILGSGDELVPPGEPLGPGQVYDANRVGLAAQARAAGAEVVASDWVRDDRAATIATLARLLDGGEEPPPDLLITIGGVSVGRHDHLRPALDAVGVSEVLYGLRIRPGHPLWLGECGDQVVLGLPGNPVSAAVCFHLFGRPLLGRDEPWDRTAPLAEAYRKGTRRADFVRCAREGDALRPLPRQGSHAISSLAGADALAWIPEEAQDLEAGAPVRWAPFEA
ncbi:MAG: molybdopterin molybdotransferase [Miltoncostaeaceae bacterium]|jgi:molybdopterin molybdotransferase|nr:molybdopterin molybdotransferase [Miltoncostaeaceae bacterium]